MPFPSLYRARAVNIKAGTIKAFVPQVFGETPVTITETTGSLPQSPGMGWVLFQAGNPEFPVWVSEVAADVGSGSTTNNTGARIYNGTSYPPRGDVSTDTTVMWINHYNTALPMVGGTGAVVNVDIVFIVDPAAI